MRCSDYLACSGLMAVSHPLSWVKSGSHTGNLNLADDWSLERLSSTKTSSYVSATSSKHFVERSCINSVARYVSLYICHLTKSSNKFKEISVSLTCALVIYIKSRELISMDRLFQSSIKNSCAGRSEEDWNN